MRQLQSGSKRAFGRFGRVLIEIELLDRDLEQRRLSFVTQALHPDMAREKILVEVYSEFLVGRPIFGWLENQNVVLEPMPRAVEMRLKVDALDRRLLHVFQTRRRFAEINYQ